MKRHSRFLAIVLTLCMVLSMLPLTALAASLTFTDKYGTWEYVEEADGTITIVGFTAARKNIAVPAMIDGKPVIRLGDGLFKNNEEITMVVIPAGVRVIGAEVFSGCTYLERVELPETINAIGDGAFSNCAVLGDLYIPSSVTELGQGVFADSPQIHVTCQIDSATAEYLQENRTEVPHFTLIEVEQTPAVPAGAEGVATGELVTYEFGRTINGKREYTLVLADSMPNLDLKSFIIKDSAGYDILDPRAWQVMDNRFKLVSLQQYDGSETRDLTPDTITVDLNPDFDSTGIAEVGYSLYVGGAQADLEQLTTVKFSAANQLMGYSFSAYDGQYSQVKMDSGAAAIYSIADSAYEYHYADGQFVRRNEYSFAQAHRATVDGSCVEIVIHKNTDWDAAQAAANSKDRRLVVKDGNGSEIVAQTSGMTDRDGILHKSGDYHQFTENRHTEARYSTATYDENGKLESVSESVIAPVPDGIYQDTWFSFDKEKSLDSSWEDHYTLKDENGAAVLEDYRTEEHSTRTNSLYYTEETIRAESVDEVYEREHTLFPNEPDEHTYDVETRSVSAEQYAGKSTVENLNTGAVSNNQWSGSWESLSDHIYIGDTGKFVGWDWSWSYHSDIDPQTSATTSQGATYTVTEYNYSSENDTWTKTEVRAYSENCQSLEDFKTTCTQDTLADYELYSDKYVFDASVEGGADNWRLLEPEENSEESEQLAAEAEAIAMGTTSVTVGDTIITQEEKKQEMLELEAELLTDPLQDKTEEAFEAVLETVSDGEELLAEVEEAVETDTLPETNTTEDWEHNCVIAEPVPDDGTPVG